MGRLDDEAPRSRNDRMGGQRFMHPLQWLRQRDPDFAALRRAGRTAIVMPAMFALGDKVIGNAALATFAAFGSFAMLLLVDFSGPMRERLRAQVALAVVGGVLVCVGTLASQTVWLAAAAMAVVGFGVMFAGVVSSVLAGAATSLLLAFILPVSLAAPVSAVPDRLAGWGMAGGAALVAVALLWPAPARDPLRSALITVCRALAARLRAEIASMLSVGDKALALDRERAVEREHDAVGGLRRAFLATPYRPTGLSTPARTVVRLVDEVSWLDTIVVQPAQHAEGAVVNRAACAVKLAAAAVLERGADLLDVTGGSSDELHAALAEMTGALTRMEHGATADLPVRRVPRGAIAAPEPVSEFITSLDPSFRARELSFAVSLIAGNIDLTAAAERRTWRERVLGRQPAGLSGTLSAAQERAAAHVERHSVWLHNSVRAAAGLGLAVLVAKLTGVQHSFWVVLGTLSVLRSSALNTGQSVVRSLAGTVVGFIIGAALLAAIGTNATLLWFVLPPAILLAGVAPAAISFTAGQAAFTLTLVILFNIIQPAGWRIGLLRIEDIALGCAVSLVVGLLFWPRGAGAALRQALAEAYTDSAGYLASAVSFGILRGDGSGPVPARPGDDAVRAAAAARRLDDTFRSYLAERGAKPLPLADVTRLVTGVAGLRLAGDAVLNLWQGDDGEAAGDRAAAGNEILRTNELVQTWYDDLASSLVSQREPREPLAHDKVADSRLVEAVRHDLRGDDGRVNATAVRMIWTGDHLDAVRRLQTVIAGPARATARLRTPGPLAGMAGMRPPSFPRRRP
ncbi:MAG TPA: FUSC family protein [Streptosporangiaceae bacterium]|nr:FUSC family protein [Streptosporangiaceae bacterium]